LKKHAILENYVSGNKKAGRGGGSGGQGGGRREPPGFSYMILKKQREA